MTSQKLHHADDIPHVDENDPLPALGIPEGRWAAPYLSDTTGLWTVHLRGPLTRLELDAGLVDRLHASEWSELKKAMARQDERAREVTDSPDMAPTWSHRP
ncbi:hypothetical protein [Actinomadura violacea]|uniref:Uncharacterized protein n=1 Tax=Actinomadura violacea TaxID=2819934 RepID=A0ABS3SAK3_9ACTN|nr:hypothetical protein [Actinomadura violacea]MBO2465219.1 hypothetical protein [Actinomadura violacea]